MTKAELKVLRANIRKVKLDLETAEDILDEAESSTCILTDELEGLKKKLRRNT